MEVRSVLVECPNLFFCFGLPTTFSILILGHVYVVLPIKTPDFFFFLFSPQSETDLLPAGFPQEFPKMLSDASLHRIRWRRNMLNFKLHNNSTIAPQ